MGGTAAAAGLGALHHVAVHGAIHHVAVHGALEARHRQDRPRLAAAAGLEHAHLSSQG